MKFLISFSLLTCCILLQGQSLASGVRPLTPPLADTFYFNGQWADAIPLYEQGIASGLSAPANDFRLAYARQQLGFYSEARNGYLAALKKKPFNPMLRAVLVNLAKVYGQFDQVDTCLLYLNLAIEQGYANLQDIQKSPEFAAIRLDKRYPTVHDTLLFRTYPCMTMAEAKWFDFWVGDWKAYVTGTTKQAGVSKIEKIAGDCAILENWTSAAGNFNGKSINFYNTKTAHWEQHWVGSAGGYQKFEHGEYKDGAMRFSFVRTNSNGTESEGRFTFFNQGQDQVRQLSESSNDQGKTWNIDYDFTYKREIYK